MSNNSFINMKVGEKKFFSLLDSDSHYNLLSRMTYYRKKYAPEKKYKTRLSKEPYGLLVTRMPDRDLTQPPKKEKKNGNERLSNSNRSSRNIPVVQDKICNKSAARAQL